LWGRAAPPGDPTAGGRGKRRAAGGGVPRERADEHRRRAARAAAPHPEVPRTPRGHRGPPPAAVADDPGRGPGRRLGAKGAGVTGAEEHPLPAEVLAAVREARRVLVLTGAGMSAESGIATFRDAQTGLWEEFDPMRLATPDAWGEDPAFVW